MKQSVRIVMIAIAMVSLVNGVFAADWQQWRGPEGKGISDEKAWNPLALKESAKIAWQKNVGDGYSSVAVKDGLLYTMGNSDKQDTVYCFDAKTGAEKWTYPYACGNSGSYKGPRATPVVDEGRVFVHSLEGHIICLDAKEGKVIWQRNAATELKAGQVKWKFSASPVVYDKYLIMNLCKAGVILDKKSGKTVWTSGPGVGGYAVPVIFKIKKRTFAAFFSQNTLAVVDLESKKVTTYPWQTSYDVNAADPIVSGNKIFVSSGYGTGCALLAFTGNSLKEVWQNKNMKNHMASPVLIDGYIYGVDDNTGNKKLGLACMSLKDGSLKWKEENSIEMFMAAGKKLIALDKNGNLVVVKASSGSYQEIARAKVLKGGRAKMWTYPVLCGGMIYCRNSKGDLVCVDVSK